MDNNKHPEFPESEDSVFGGINLLARSLRDLDERGLVLSLAAFSEEALGDLLKAFLIPTEATKQLVDGFNAPLGTFSSRIKAAYSIGLITKEQFFDLERLRKIRNEFAHTWKPIDISSQKIATLIESMAFSRIDDQFPETLTEKIRSSMSCLLVEIRSSTHQIKKRGLHAKLVGNNLMRGFTGEELDTQIQNAREELAHFSKNLDGAVGKRRDFYRTRLLQLKDRMTVLPRPKSLEQEKALNDLILEFSRTLLLHRGD